MRVVLLFIILAIVAVIAAVATGFLVIDQRRAGRTPEVGTTQNGVAAQSGRAPAFDVETGSIKVGSTAANVTLPTLEVTRPADNRAEAAPDNGV